MKSAPEYDRLYPPIASTDAQNIRSFVPEEYQMAIDDFHMCPSNGKELVFRGELIAQASSDRVSAPEGERWFDLRVYRREDTGLVPAIEFHSTYDGEEDVTIAEVVDRAHDVENFFYVFEPCDLLTDKVLNAMPIEERQRLTSSILKLYDSLVNRVLLSAKEGIPKEASSGAENTAEKKGLLGLLGLK